MEDLDEIVHEFLVESHENLDQLDSDLVALEAAPGSKELLGSVFRTIHTIKGTSGFLAFTALERVTHAGENLLVELRDGRRSMDLPTTDVLLEMVDTVREILRRIEADGSEGDIDVDPVVARVTAVLENRAAVAAEPAPEPAAQPEPAPEPEPVAEPTPEPVLVASAAAPLVAATASPAVTAAPIPPAGSASAPPHPEALVRDTTAEPAGTAAPTAQIKIRGSRRPKVAAAEQPAQTTSAPVVDVPTGVHAGSSGDVPSPHLPPEPQAAARPTSPSAPAARVPAAEPEAETGTARTAAEGSIRVDVELLDALMRQVGELVLARNAISRLAVGASDIDFVRASQRLSLIASELQEGVMKTRMQPIEHVWSKVPRMVRDLAAACEKQVRLEMVGGDTELDRSLLEAIKDPLTHLIRNAVDHGVEMPAERAAAGKPAQGVLSLRAYHAGGQVVVEVVDDGRGIDVDRVAAKAVERGLRTHEQVAAMAPAELMQLLFLAGFSTAEAVTNVSGRGVGMDVVRTKIEAIGGTVDVDSTLGRGTTWRLRIPLTLAIMPALTVECDREFYAIPQVSLLELVALDAQTSGAIEYVRSAPVYRLRGDLLPLVDLREVFDAPPRGDRSGSVIAVLQADTQRFGLLVDRVLNTEEIVVKPMSGRLKAIGLYAGATLLGDGRVSLILDVQAIGRRAMAGERGEAVTAAKGVEDVVTRETVQVLVAGIGGDRRVAIPLSAVTRLEKLPTSMVEHVGGREVVQYRGAITPVVRLDRMLGSAGSAEERAELTVVVYSRGERSVAIVVDEIVDIVDDDASHHSDVGDHGLVGSTVLKDRVTELLDIRTAVAAADPLFFSQGAEEVRDEIEQLAERELVGGVR